MSKVTQSTVQHIAQLAQIPVSKEEVGQLAAAFEETLEVVDQLQQLETHKVAPTHHVTGLKNVWREDVINEAQVFTQEEALANAPKTHNGYFVVPKILNKD